MSKVTHKNKRLQVFIDKSLYTIDDILSGIKGKATITPAFIDELIQVAVASNYALGQFKNFPELLIDLMQTGDLDSSYSHNALDSKLAQCLSQVHTEKELGRVLRFFRRREWLRIVWRDALNKAGLDETLFDTTTLAEVCVVQTVRTLQAWLEKNHGIPCDSFNNAQRLSVVAMGKLGGSELNLSSDIDLVFYYPEPGVTQGVDIAQANQDFFLKLSQQIINVLNDVTDHGFVFRVDMRLRPYGRSGPLVTSLSTLKDYLMNNAYDWERYAYLKSRLINGNQEEQEAWGAFVNQFVYESRSDEKVLRGLHRIKSRVIQQHMSTSLTTNIKLGPGGIRQIEFIAQAFQLIHGREDPSLHVTPLIEALDRLETMGLLHPSVARRLKEAYRFLRCVENRLQMLADKQVHVLPDDPSLRARLASSLASRHWPAFLNKLALRRSFVILQFNRLINDPLYIFASSDVSQAMPLFNYQCQKEVEQSIQQWMRRIRHSFPSISGDVYKSIASNVRAKLKRMPGAHAAFERICMVVDAVFAAGDVTCFQDELFINKMILLCSRSHWLISELVQDVSLMIELLSADSIHFPEDLQTMHSRLKGYLKKVDPDDQEQFLYAVRYFKYEYLMRVAVADVLGQLPVMRVSDLLTDIAISILRVLLGVSWRTMTKQYGFPLKTDGERSNNSFIIVAYGKLGGIELSYKSDLDLVFIHDIDESAMTSGKNPISGSQFYLRMTQQMIKLLSTQTSIGRLYNIDTRLKPQGDAGLLVTSFKAYADYQQEKAWTWEHQALVRARVVAGDKVLSQKFHQLRNEVLSKSLDLDKLRCDIIEMREKMRAEKPPAEGVYNLKRDVGGITDIEFMAQYVVLAWAKFQPMLLIFPDNIRIFETCESGGLLPRKTVDTLCRTYRLFRKERHHLMLLGKKGLVSVGRHALIRAEIKKIWDELLVF